ncbi:hypothetical protein NPIL_646001 [Nephila pilipes]|uniref:Uncharacterized protein n=1 Tax=Nephila pilipes TaxID=299642 RepID=A0A8X6NT89_NEPPI|nr:hypothetical protein NPIL_646001 [Nephila pilipes]
MVFASLMEYYHLAIWARDCHAEKLEPNSLPRSQSSIKQRCSGPGVSSSPTADEWGCRCCIVAANSGRRTSLGCPRPMSSTTPPYPRSPTSRAFMPTWALVRHGFASLMENATVSAIWARELLTQKTRAQLISPRSQTSTCCQRCLDRHAVSPSTSTADGGGAGDVAVLVAKPGRASLGRTFGECSPVSL